jgi:hypothetical protein
MDEPLKDSLQELFVILCFPCLFETFSIILNNNITKHKYYKYLN